MGETTEYHSDYTYCVVVYYVTVAIAVISRTPSPANHDSKLK